jgi:L-threonine-O-3-phosphate decarboxylase
MSIKRPLHGGNLIWAATLADCSPSAILDFSASINPLGLPNSAIAVLQDCLPTLSAYPDPNYTHLRQAIAEFHNISPDWVLPGNGAADLLTWACRELAALDSTVLLTPAFSDYFRALKAFDGNIATCDCWARVKETIQNQALQDSIPLSVQSFFPSSLQFPVSGTGLLLNNPHNPTGQLFSRSSIQGCLDRFGLVVVDEAFMDFLPPGEEQSVIDLVQAYPNLVVLRSLTKFYSVPGLRLGYAIAHPDRLKRWQEWRDPWAVNAIAAAVGEVVLRDAPFQQQTWNWLADARPQLFTGFAHVPGLTPFPSAANFLLVKSEFPVPELQRQLLVEHHILIRDCISFPELGDRYFRTAIRTLAENQQLLDGLSKIRSNVKV